jgi:hypothetical protein
MAHPLSMAFQVAKFQDGILLNTLQASSIVPHFAYMSTKLFVTKTFELYPQSMMCWWTHLPSSVTTTLAHAFSTHTKVTGLGHTPSCCICQNSSSTFCPSPHFTCPNIMAFQVITFQNGILLNTLQASSMLPPFAYMSTKLLHTKHLNPSTMNNLLMSTPALFKRNHAGTCIQQPHKSNRAWVHTFLLHLSK